MKRRDLVKLLESNGFVFKRNGSNHDIYANGKVMQPVPLHREVKEELAKAIIKRHGLK